MARKYRHRKCLDLSERLWSNVDKSGDCWIWKRSVFTQTGYGQIRVNGTSRTAHRVAYEVTFGPIPDGLYVCHRCDVRVCCNPAHLFLGTAQDNMTDMVQKGRYTPRVLPHGSAVHNAKLIEAQVAEIKSALLAGHGKREIGRRFGVTGATVSSIGSGKTWRHVQCEPS